MMRWHGGKKSFQSRGRRDSGWATEPQVGLGRSMYHYSFKGVTDEMCSLKAEWKQAWGFDSFAKHFLEITMSIAPKTWNVHVTPSVKTFYSFPQYCLLFPFWQSCATSQFESYAKCKQPPKTLFKSISVWTSTTVKVLPDFWINSLLILKLAVVWELIMISLLFLVICMFISCNNHLRRKYDMWDTKNCSVLYF